MLLTFPANSVYFTLAKMKKSNFNYIFNTSYKWPNKYRSFNSRYSKHRDPDLNDYYLEHGMSEFSAHAELNFEKYLKRMRSV